MFALQRIVALKEALKGGTLIECTGPNGGPRRFLTYSDGTYFELRRLSDSAVDAGIVLISADVPKEVSRRILDWRRERSLNDVRLGNATPFWPTIAKAASPATEAIMLETAEAPFLLSGLE